MISAREFNAILDEGIRLWDEQKFFECHDKLEEAWKAVKQEKKAEKAADARRDFVHGLILSAVAYLHWRNKNAVGALRKFAEAERLLTPYEGVYAGVDVSAVIAANSANAARLRRDPQTPFDERRVPSL